ncbi:hypothetical protein T01_9743 [Trichinella spiralis]|uniref:Uncharacterized protein n=1 Tax=Trichinella spiralis TaxID=6334 RepID=A0A0V0YPB4_TRISP|nr:hypothetical protein T01_9743 [Trichinella spiralis]
MDKMGNTTITWKKSISKLAIVFMFIHNPYLSL